MSTMDSRSFPRWQGLVSRRSGVSSAKEQPDIPESYSISSDLEDGGETPRKQSGIFSWLRPTRRRETQVLDDELFRQAKTSQTRSEWPSFNNFSTAGSSDGNVQKSFYQGGKLRPNVLKQNRRPSSITKHVKDLDKRRTFILKLAKCLLAFGSPSHRIESQLSTASEILNAQAAFVHIPGVIIVTFGDADVASVETHFVKANGRIALTSLQKVHRIYRQVLHDKMCVEVATKELRRVLHARPIYSLYMRCFFAFICASAICAMAFGGSIIDMWVSGVCAAILQYLDLNTASKSSVYANVYEISVAIAVSFAARALSSIESGNLFCYNAISSAGVVLILPGFTILISALELTSRSILCGSVRMVYAIIYTLFLGFGLTIGSDIYLVVNPHGRRALQRFMAPNYTHYHGHFHANNGSAPVTGGVVFGFAKAPSLDRKYILRGCHRDPEWPWWRQPLPWWSLFILVPIYSVCSSLSNQQELASWQLVVMVSFACLAFVANRLGNVFLPDQRDLVSAGGALVIGLLGNVYSGVVRGTAFTSMVTGVLFLVPSGIASGGGLLDGEQKSAQQQYSSGFSLAIRMIRVSIGITVGLFVSQIFVYAMGRRKHAAYFAF